MTLKEFKNKIAGKKITIMGLGLHSGGLGAAKFFIKLGAKVLVTDLKKEDELKDSLKRLSGLPIKYALGQHRTEDFTNADLVIKNPGIPENSKYLELARKSKVPIESDVGLFFELCPGQIIGITGTKGKSTTSTLIYEILKKKYEEVILAGNIRTSVLEQLFKIDADSISVLELSSWQLADAAPHRKSPHCAVITNIMPDHLNRYNNFDDYIEDKKNIFRFQKKDNFLVLNYDNPITKDFGSETRAKVYFYSLNKNFIDELYKDSQKEEENLANLGAFIRDDKIVFGEKEEEICDTKSIKLKGKHNLANILAATTTARLYKVSPKTIRKVLKKFRGLEGRLQFIREIDGVKYYNDTAATIPDAASEGLKTFAGSKKRIILIAGGGPGKTSNYSDFVKKIKKYVKALVLLNGSASEELENLLEGNSLEIQKAESMAEAVNKASKEAKPGDIILLSPGCASFEGFKHEFDRGDQFNAAVKTL